MADPSKAAMERAARIIDPDAWHETLPQDGCGAYWIGRRNRAREKASAILDGDGVVEQAAQALYEEDDPWAKVWVWPNLQSHQGNPDTYRRLASAALTAAGYTITKDAK